MQQPPSQLKTYPTTLVGSVTSAQDWEAVAQQTDMECDWIELRLDCMTPMPPPEQLRRNTPRPLLITVRGVEEGGRQPWPDLFRIALLYTYIPVAHAIDIELACLHTPEAQELVAAAHANRVMVIASSHDFQGTPDIEDLLLKELNAYTHGADIAKFAFMINKEEDIDTGSTFLARCYHPESVAVMGMGELGAASRLRYAREGSVLTYGYLGSAPAAHGQWSVSDFNRALSEQHGA